MKITITTLANKLPQWLESATRFYLKRFKYPFDVNIHTIKPKQWSHTLNLKQRIEQQTSTLLSYVPKGNYLIMLDTRGKQLDSQNIAESYADFLARGLNISILIGGPDGFAEKNLAMANQIWSLSCLTLPHNLAQLLLLEQTYRAMTILQGHPYHK